MDTATRQSFTTRYVRLLLFWRWLIVLASVAMAVVIEISEGHALYLALLEVALYGLVIPSCIWVLFTLLAQNMARRARSEGELARHQYLAQHLAHYQEYNELSNFIGRFFSSILSVDFAELLVYDHQKSQWELAFGREDAITASFSTVHDVNLIRMCEAWHPTHSARLHRTTECSKIPAPIGDMPNTAYCLPLVYQGLFIGVLRLRCRPEHDLSADQMGFLDAISTQIALTLALSIAQRRQLKQAQIDERRQLAYELHDSLAQQIGYLHLSLDRLTTNGNVTQAETLQHELSQMREVAEDAYGRVRSNLSILRTWQHSDLTPAIANYVHKLSQRTGMQIEFHTKGNPLRLALPKCQQILWLVRESLGNLESHSHARQAGVQLNWLDDCLQIEICDDGVGFDASVVPENHFGLAMMRERTEQLGGQMKLDSVRGKGTQLTFVIPLLS